jgi:hypothetical protein
MIDTGKEVGQYASWPTGKRIAALKRILPRAKVEEVLAAGHGNSRFCRRLPRWFVVWFVVSLGLFCRDSYQQVFRWLERYGPKQTPGRSTLCEARKRLGPAPLRRLAQAVIRLLGTPGTPGAFYQDMRLMALDGFIVDVPDTPTNEHAFGRPGSGRSPGAFPQVRVLSLCEVGSHVLWRSLLKPCHRGEISMTPYLLRFLMANMLLLWDRNFLSYDLVRLVIGRRAQLLARIKKNLVFQPIQAFSDGSYLAKLYPTAKARRHDTDGIVVRIIDYTFDDANRPGSGEKHRLLTTLLDKSLHPAQRLIELYHERWEEEMTIDELKTHQRERPVLRSQTPAGVVQEIYGLLLGHYAIRTLMWQAAAGRGLDPDRLSFTDALKILRCRLPECPWSRCGLRLWHRALLAEISEAINPPRRNRINPRVIKKKMSGWAKKRPQHRHYHQPLKNFRESIVMLN